MRVEVRLLGQGQVRGPDGTVVDARAWRTTKTFDLLRVLALSGGRPISTDSLVDLFWPTTDLARGRTSLRTAASQIRKTLGADSVVRVGNGLALSGVWVDTEAYRDLAAQVEEAAARGHLATVVKLVHEAEGLYAGDLEVVGTDCSFLHEARTQLRTLRTHLLLEASEAAARCSGWRQALELAQRAGEIEVSDRSARAAMRAWYALGETGKPIEEFERLRRHLTVEYGVDPAPKTRALYLHLVSECAQWPPDQLTVGRDEQVRQVATAMTGWLMDPDTPGGVVWLAGDRGAGRKTVAREAARSLMLSLAEHSDDESPATVELLQDQGTLTRELAATFRERATAHGRVLLVPVSDVPPGTVLESDAVVAIPPLDRASFRKLLIVALQGRPTARLEEELYQESRGLPGLACHRARLRLHHGNLSWTPEGVDLARSRLGEEESVWTKLRTAMALVPIAWLSLFGSDEPGPLMERRGAEESPSSVALGSGRLVAARTRPGSDPRARGGRRRGAHRASLCDAPV
ncbi:MAG TPA: BTAD domain-containing putative transcriptional regulator [Nocardioides sp.]|nr:BTAD domain-containing putative transcriptional regulator [Nocardioides sp.]